MKTLSQLEAKLEEASKLKRLSAKEMGFLKRGDKVRISFVPKGKFSPETHNAKVLSNQGGTWSYILDNGKAVSQLRVNSHKVFKKINEETISEALKKENLSFGDQIDQNKKHRNGESVKIDAALYDQIKKKFAKAKSLTITSQEAAIRKQKVDIHTKSSSIFISPFGDFLQVRKEDMRNNTKKEFYRVK